MIAPLKTIVFTVCTAQQYPFAQVLADSLPSSIIFKVGIVKGKITNQETVSLEELSLPKLGEMRERYDDSALSAAAMPFFAEYFLLQEEADNLIYFDPTMRVVGELDTIVQTLQAADIVLAPRLTRKFGKSVYGDEKLFLNTGMYDTGFWAIRKTENASRFLKWWQDRLADCAHFDLCNGMNHAQLWLNYVPLFFEKVLVSKNIGWNVSLQNLHERVLTKQNKKWVVNLNEPLVFMNFREMMDKTTSVKTIVQQSGVEILVTDYRNKLKMHGDTIPSIFSLHQTQNSSVLGWQNMLRQKIKIMINSINQFPLYHKTIK